MVILGRHDEGTQSFEIHIPRSFGKIRKTEVMRMTTYETVMVVLTCLTLVVSLMMLVIKLLLIIIDKSEKK